MENLSGLDKEQQEYEFLMEHQFDKNCPVIPNVDEFIELFDEVEDGAKSE